jgi:hypothetical protein
LQTMAAFSGSVSNSLNACLFVYPTESLERLAIGPA